MKLKQELSEIIEKKLLSKIERKYLKNRLYLFNLCLDRLSEKNFTFVEADLFNSFKEQ